MRLKKFFENIYTIIFLIIGFIFISILFFRSSSLIMYILLVIILSILASIIGYKFGKLLEEFKTTRFFYLMIIIFLFYLILTIGINFSLSSRYQKTSRLNIFSNECKEFPMRSHIPWYYIESDKCFLEYGFCSYNNGTIIPFSQSCEPGYFENIKSNDVKPGFKCCIPIPPIRNN